MSNASYCLGSGEQPTEVYGHNALNCWGRCGSCGKLLSLYQTNRLRRHSARVPIARRGIELAPENMPRVPLATWRAWSTGQRRDDDE